MKKVYIACPITIGDSALNCRRAILAASELVKCGYAPFCPGTSILWHMVDPQPYDTWLQIDLPWLLSSDAVLRLPGDSLGADIEVAVADYHKIPVFYHVEHLTQAIPSDPIAERAMIGFFKSQLLSRRSYEHSKRPGHNAEGNGCAQAPADAQGDAQAHDRAFPASRHRRGYVAEHQ